MNTNMNMTMDIAWVRSLKRTWTCTYISMDRDPVLDADTVMSGKRIFKNTYKIELSWIVHRMFYTAKFIILFMNRDVESPSPPWKMTQKLSSCYEWWIRNYVKIHSAPWIIMQRFTPHYDTWHWSIGKNLLLKFCEINDDTDIHSTPWMMVQRSSLCQHLNIFKNIF
jgi:hypothetical protein